MSTTIERHQRSGGATPRPSLDRAWPARAPAPDTGTRRTAAMLWSTLLLSTSVLAASLYGLLAETPYRSLPEATVLGARAQDACSIVVAVLLVVLAVRPTLGTTAALLLLGLLG